MGADNAARLYTVILCGGMGFLLGAFYEVFRLLRLWLRPPKAAVFVMDVVCCVSASPAVFLFLLAVTDGRPRLAAAVGLSVGFFAFRFTVGRWLTPPVYRLLRNGAKIRKLFSKNT